ncbi:hypothetical protein [Synechococcus sp. MU1655]|uniref:hypothetical protein n=1 Tax=Synechococcus sp. MU1655 TaxID=2508355 RepID=UPI00202627FC|nr:hypothetical protein [Synechococcus sp. MU1655]
MPELARRARALLGAGMGIDCPAPPANRRLNHSSLHPLDGHRQQRPDPFAVDHALIENA